MSNTRIVVWAVWAFIGIILLVGLWLYFTGPTYDPYIPPSPHVDTTDAPDSVPTTDIPTNDLPQGGKG